MSLTQRFTTFFLVALALVLVGYTAALYQIARVHLRHQVDERLDAALATLCAAIEIKPDFVEWEPAERKLTLGIDSADDQPRWVIRDDSKGRIVARSGNLGTDDSNAVFSGLADGEPRDAKEPIRTSFREPERGRWRMKVLRVRPNDSDEVRRSEKNEPIHPGEHYASLVISVGLPTRFVDRTLQTLLMWSAGLSTGLWLAAALFGRRLGRRALRPVALMADNVRSIPVTDLSRRLTSPGTDDELEGLAVAFNSLLGRVEDAFVRQKQFTAEASHQLRTPLTALLGQADVALRRERTPDEYRETLARVVRQGQGLVRIVEGLLFLARADADQDLPDCESITLGTFTRDQLVRWTDHARAADLSTSISDESAGAFAPPELLAQVFDNLIDNALKYSSPGQGVVVRVRTAEGVAMIDVEDHGIGMSVGDQSQLFRPFFRSSEVRKRGISGVGLGLSVVKRLVDAMGATLTVNSLSGSGSTFSVVFTKPSEKKTASQKIVGSCPD